MNSNIYSSESMQPLFDVLKQNTTIVLAEDELTQLMGYVGHQSFFLGGQQNVMAVPSPTRSLAELTSRSEIIDMMAKLFDTQATARILHLAVNEYWLLNLISNCIYAAMETGQAQSLPFKSDVVTLALAEMWLPIHASLRHRVSSGMIDKLTAYDKKAAEKAGLFVVDCLDPEGDQEYVNPVFLPDAQVEYLYDTLFQFRIMRPYMNQSYKLCGQEAVIFLYQLMMLQVDGGSDPFWGGGHKFIELVCKRDNDRPETYRLMGIAGSAPHFSAITSGNGKHVQVERYDILVETLKRSSAERNEVALEVHLDQFTSTDGHVVSYVHFPPEMVPAMARLLKVRNPNWTFPRR